MCDVPRNAVSAWVRNNGKLLALLGKSGSNFKQLKLHSGYFRKVDKAVYTWFISKRSKQIPIDNVILKDKTLWNLQKLLERQASKYQIVG